MVAKEHTVIRVLHQNVVNTIERIVRYSNDSGEIMEHVANETPYLGNNTKMLMRQCKLICKHKITDFDVIVITNTIKELYEMYARVDSLKASLEQVMSNKNYVNRLDFVDRFSKHKISDILNDQLEIISECATNIYRKVQQRNVNYRLI